MSTNLEWMDITLGIGSILAAGGFALLVKKILHGYRRPNNKKGGIISLHAALAFSTITVIAMTTKDWFITGLSVLLAYLIGKGRLEENQHYPYQVAFGTIAGVGITFGIFYLYNKKFGGGGSATPVSDLRESYSDKPERARDDRHEADTEKELAIDDDMDF